MPALILLPEFDFAEFRAFSAPILVREQLLPNLVHWAKNLFGKFPGLAKRNPCEAFSSTVSVKSEITGLQQFLPHLCAQNCREKTLFTFGTCRS